MRDIDPAIWGGDAWRFLHAIAHSYPTEPDRETRGAMYQLLTSLHVLLPCSQCRQHLRDFTRETGLRGPGAPALQSRAALSEWLDRAHKNANRHRDERLAASGATGGAVALPPVVAPTSRPRPPVRPPVTLVPDVWPPPAQPLLAAGALVAPHQQTSAERFAASLGIKPLDRMSDETKRSLVGVFSASAIGIFALFVALVAVTCRRRTP
jgi:hypothetical protein